VSAKREVNRNEATSVDIFGATLTRRRLVKGAGAMLVGGVLVGAAGIDAKTSNAAVFGPSSGANVVPLIPGTLHSPDPSQTASWLNINADGTMVMRTGIPEMGQGSASTAFAMITAEELNVPVATITQVVMGDSDRTSSGGIGAGYMSLGAPNVRAVAATVYQALLSMASTELGVPVGSLTVTNGVVSGGGKTVSYGQLVSGHEFNLTIPITGSNTSFLGMTVLATPPTKPVADYTIIGTSVPMRTIPGIVTGSATYVGDVVIPGMLHARVVHPKDLGSTLVSVGTLPKSGFPNTRIVVKGNLVAVVDPEEYVAIEAASILAGKTTWTTWAGLPGSDNLFSAMRGLDWTSTPPSHGVNVGNPSAALATAATKLSETYEYPVEKHAPIGPTAAVGDVRSDGTVWVHMHNQNPGALRGEIATMMNTSLDNVIVRWYDGSGQYGRGNGGNTGAEEEAVIISQEVGKPVRLQWMRWDDMQWSSQHPSVLSDIQAGLDANGKLVSFNAQFYETAGQDDRPVGALLAGLPTMAAPAVVPPVGSFSGTSNGISDTWVYDQVPNALQTGFGGPNMGSHLNDPNYQTEIGLRGHSMRTPGQRQQNFAQESMMNELAAAAKMDPIEFRLANTSAERLINVLNTLKTESGWVTRPSPSPHAATTGSTALTGQGCSQMLRSTAYWGCVAQVSVVPKTGKVTVTHITTVVDPGIVVNPLQLERMAQGGATMGTSETLHEQVHFNTGAITDHDWVSFPILRFTELPVIKVVVIPNSSVGVMGGGGEGPNGFVPAAIAAAVFDATGKQPRRLPLIPGYIRDLLAS
jgi:CO/xanthine dehydrogenase Mo-binding subunit